MSQAIDPKRSPRTLRLKPGRERSVRIHHPWIFSGALSDSPGGLGKGETVRIDAADGTPLAVGAVSPVSQIAVRVWSFNPGQTIDESFFRARLETAIAKRRLDAGSDPATARRLVNAESDGLPGLIVDRYAEFLVCQFLSAGAAYWKLCITGLLQELCSPRGIYERSDSDVREKEGLGPEAGTVCGESPPALLEVHVKKWRFLVDVRHGHKTGLYLDQSDNLEIVAGAAAGREVLNGFLAMKGTLALAKQTIVPSGDVALLLGEWLEAATVDLDSDAAA